MSLSRQHTNVTRVLEFFKLKIVCVLFLLKGNILAAKQ